MVFVVSVLSTFVGWTPVAEIPLSFLFSSFDERQPSGAKQIEIDINVE